MHHFKFSFCGLDKYFETKVVVQRPLGVFAEQKKKEEVVVQHYYPHLRLKQLCNHESQPILITYRWIHHILYHHSDYSVYIYCYSKPSTT